MFTLGATRNRALKQRTLDWAVKSGQVKLQDTFYPIGSVTGTTEGAELAWRYFQEVRTLFSSILFKLNYTDLRNC
jgi:hypothetical protein